MESITHTLLGGVLGKTGLEKKTPLAMPALLVAANLPDAEILLRFTAQNYLDLHRGVTHAAAGILPLSLGLAGCLWIFSRLAKLKAARGAKFLPLWCVSLIGMLCHPMLDSLNDYGIRPLLPFREHRYYGDLVSIADPWMWIIFATPLALSTTSRMGGICWLALGLLLAAVSFLGWGWELGLIWIGVACIALVVGHYLRSRGFKTARAALLVLLVYLGALALSRESVLSKARAFGPALVPDRVEQVDVLPGRRGGGHAWRVVMTTEQKFYLAEVGFEDWSRNPPTFVPYEKNLDDPRFLKSLEHDDMAALLRFARFPCVTVLPNQGSHLVILRDLRYATRGSQGWAIASTTVR